MSTARNFSVRRLSRRNMLDRALTLSPLASSPAPLALDASAAVVLHRRPVPDLLHPIPVQRVDVAQTKHAIAMAFASGVSGGLFAEALDRSKVAASSWQPHAFASDLFLTTFVTRCFTIRARTEDGLVSAGHLVKLLASPPSDPASVDHRRAVVTELLASSDLRGELERLYVALDRFRALLEGATGEGKWDPTRRQLDILKVLKDIFDRAASGFASASSGLATLSIFGKRIQASEAYRALADILRYDEQLATLDIKVRVGADGKIRGFQIVSVEENAANPFVRSPWRRWIAKIELFFRGFRFSDNEIMARLIDTVFDGLEDEVVHLVQLLGDVEF